MNDLRDLTARQQLESKALDSARWLKCLLNAKPDVSPLELFREHYYASPHRQLVERAYEERHKAAVAGGTPTAGNWAAPLMPTSLGEAIAAYANQFSVLQRAGVTPVPFNVRMPAESAALVGFGWIGNKGLAIKVTKGSFTSGVTLTPLTAAGIIVLSRELIRFSSPKADVFLRDRLARGISRFLDAQFVDHTLAAVADTSPAGITYGVTPIDSAGTSAANAATDFGNLLEAYLDGGGSAETAAILMASRTAAALRLSGHSAFEQLTRSGGSVAGIPVVAGDAVGMRVVLLDTARVLLADEGAVDIQRADSATIQMSDSPTHNVSTPTESTQVGLFQTGSTAIKVMRTINWEAMSGGVQFIDEALYGAVGSPA